MRRIVDVLHRFRQDERGAFAVIFAVIAIVLIALGGASVDFTSLQQARMRSQVALDAAALSLQPTMYSATPVVIQGEAQALLVTQLADGATTWANCTTNGNKAPCVSVATPVVDTVNGQLTLTANMQVPMNFVDLVGVMTLPAQILSVATRKKLNLEVAMVLDNSGSMYFTMGSNSHLNNTSPTRMQTLQSSAVCASNILFYGVTTCAASTSGLTANTDVKIGLVPFTLAVDVGAANASATWLDRTGNGNITDNNFDNDDNDNGGTTAATVDTFAGPIDRIALINGMKDNIGNALSWGGCVEARKSTYDTDDTTPDSTHPDTLYTPYFAPDEPDTGSGFSNNYISDTPVACNKIGTCNTSSTTTYSNVTTIIVAKGTETVTKNSNGSQVSSKNITTTVTTGPVAQNQSTNAPDPTITTATGTTRQAPGVCSCSGAGTTTQINSNLQVSGPSNSSSSIPSDVVTNNTPVSGQKTTDHYTSATKEVDTQPVTAATTNTCQASYAPWVLGASGSSANSGLTQRELQERICKYTGAQMTSAPSAPSVFGPNGDCPAASVLPLSSSPSTVTAAINAMAASGGTNITEGSVWGWHVLSPNSPFSSQGAPYGNATSKVMIIMTDGENTIYPGTNMNYDTYYSAYGYPWNNRLGVVTSTDTTLEAIMNTRLTTVCTNAKNAGITIYTIGVDSADTTNPTATQALLTGCASSPANAFFPNTATDLQATFVSIANQLAALRLAK